jgi:hypothetical protein
MKKMKRVPNNNNNITIFLCSFEFHLTMEYLSAASRKWGSAVDFIGAAKIVHINFER